MTIDRKFYFADKAILAYPINNPGRYHSREHGVKIIGKIKDADAYVINALSVSFNSLVLVELKNRYGYPIRHIALEWGKFNGYVTEFVVPGCDLEKI